MMAATDAGDDSRRTIQAVYDMICRADTIGVFQIESRAQMSMLPRLRPRSFYDLVIEVAIVRPGPIQGNMVHPYLRRRAGRGAGRPIPTTRSARCSHKTLGVPLFQEQAMRLAVVAAGFTPGEADQLRRAMGAWRRPGVIEQFRAEADRRHAGQRAYRRSSPSASFRQIRGFGEYGFPESHAASFALLVYVSAWLKHYYPAAFAAALLNSQPMGSAQSARDAREHGVEVRPVDVECEWVGLSAGRGWDWGEGLGNCKMQMANCKLRIQTRRQRNGSSSPKSASPEPYVLRFGLRMLNGLRADAAAAIERAREAGPFLSIDDFSRRTGLGQGVIKRLAEAGCVRLARGKPPAGAMGIARPGKERRVAAATGLFSRAGRLPVFSAARSLAGEAKMSTGDPTSPGGSAASRSSQRGGAGHSRRCRLYERSRRRLPLRGPVAAGASDFVLSRAARPARNHARAADRGVGQRRHRSAWRGLVLHCVKRPRHGQRHHVRHAGRRNGHDEPGGTPTNVGPLLSHCPRCRRPGSPMGIFKR